MGKLITEYYYCMRYLVAIRDLFLFQIVSEILSSRWQGTPCEMGGDSVNMLSPFMMDCPWANQ